MSKFENAWADIARQNIVLFFVLGCTTFLSVVMVFLTLKTSLAPPIVIDSCDDVKGVIVKDQIQSEKEIINFSKLVFHQRFDENNEPNLALISEEEIRFKSDELRDLAEQGFGQRVLLREAKLSGQKVAITSDRILTGENFKSALPFNIELTFASVKRSRQNPWGLVLIKSVQIKNKEDVHAKR